MEMNKIIAKRIEENDIFYREEHLIKTGKNKYTILTKENGSEYISDSFISKDLPDQIAEDWVGWFDSTLDGWFHKGCSNEAPATVADRCFQSGNILIYHKWVN